MAPRTAKPAPQSKPAAPKTKTPAKAKPKAKAKAKPAPKAKPKAKAKVKAKPAPQAKALPKAKAKTKPAPKAKPAAQANAKPAPKAAKTKAAPLPPASSPKARAAKAGPAREARQAAAMKKVIAEVIAPVESGTVVVDAYMRDIDHPFKAEMEAVRAIILAASPKVAERIKWNAPSFFYKEDLGAFHPRASEFAHLVLLFPNGAGIPAKSSLLEGTQKDRREAKFSSLADVEAKKSALTKLVKEWVKLRDA